MNDWHNVTEEFKSLVEKHFAFLQTYGFRRSSIYEHVSPVGCSMVFLGKNVGITISLDIRDNCIDVAIARVSEGALKRNWEGGYSSGLFTYLVKYAGYSARASSSTGRKRIPAENASIEQMIMAWANLLTSAGEILLKDMPDSLPR